MTNTDPTPDQVHSFLHRTLHFQGSSFQDFPTTIQRTVRRTAWRQVMDCLPLTDWDWSCIRDAPDHKKADIARAIQQVLTTRFHIDLTIW